MWSNIPSEQYVSQTYIYITSSQKQYQTRIEIPLCFILHGRLNTISAICIIEDMENQRESST